jgi:hypothetical protein
MATYFLSVHALLHRLHAEKAVDEELCCHSDASFEDVDFDVQRSARLEVIERKNIDMRSNSCPATTIAVRRPQRVDT